MIDFNDPAFVANPYAGLKELRSFGKPVWHDGLGIFLAACHGDANDVFRNKSLGRIFQSLSGIHLIGCTQIQFWIVSRLSTRVCVDSLLKLLIETRLSQCALQLSVLLPSY